MKCTKVSFINQEYADMYIEKLRKTSTREIKPIRSYLCPQCLTWHLTKIRSVESSEVINRNRQIENLKNKIILLESDNKKLRQTISTYFNSKT